MKWVILATACATAVATMAAAEENTVANPPPASNKVVLSRGQTIQAAVAGMAKAAGAMVAVDPGLTGRVSEATSKLPLEKGLDAIAAANRAQWRKMYLAPNEIPRLQDGSIDARRLAVMVREVTRVKTANIGVADPATGQLTVVTRAPENAPSMQEWMKTRNAVYILFMPNDDSLAPAPGGPKPPFNADDIRNMTPEQRTQWMKENGGVFISTDMSPEERARALQNLPPEERARLDARIQEARENGGNAQIMIMRKESSN